MDDTCQVMEVFMSRKSVNEIKSRDRMNIRSNSREQLVRVIHQNPIGGEKFGGGRFGITRQDHHHIRRDFGSIPQTRQMIGFEGITGSMMAIVKYPFRQVMSDFMPEGSRNTNRMSRGVDPNSWAAKKFRVVKIEPSQ
jgi:hypothetical protein